MTLPLPASRGNLTTPRPRPWPASAVGVAPAMALALALAATVLALAPRPASAVPDTLAQRALACTHCHQVEDRQTPHGYIPRLAGKPAGYLFEQMRNFRDGRRTHEGMAHLLEPLDDRYLRELASHFASLTPSHHAPVAARVSKAQAQAARRWILHGDRRLGIPACSACHGAALTGVAPDVPGLLGLPAAYLSAQMGAWRQGLRHAREPDCMARIARALPAEDIPALARWLEAQPLPTPPTPGPKPATWPLDCGSLPK